MDMGVTIFLAVVVSLFICGIFLIIWAPIARKKNQTCTRKTEGVLEDVINNPDVSGGPGYVYSYKIGGTEYKFETDEPSPNAKTVGDHCTIWYNPDKPNIARAVVHNDKYYKIFFFIGLTIVSLILLLIVIFVIIALTVAHP